MQNNRPFSSLLSTVRILIIAFAARNNITTSYLIRVFLALAAGAVSTSYTFEQSGQLHWMVLQPSLSQRNNRSWKMPYFGRDHVAAFVVTVLVALVMLLSLTFLTRRSSQTMEAVPNCAAAAEGWPRVLVVLLAETRASELTFSNFEDNVLKPLNADLAVCVSSNSPPEDPYMKAAKYKWLYPEQSDWAQGYDYACKCKDCWRPALQIRDQLFGGIVNPEYQQNGSAGILIFFRWYLLDNLVKSGVAEMYDYFMITRSDYYYLAHHPRIVNSSEPGLIWFPEGQDYNGLTDRHVLVPRVHLYASLSLMDPICEDPQHLFESMSMMGAWNLEQYIELHFQKQGILQFVRRFPRVMFAVRNFNTTTRWSEGIFVPEIGMIVKYLDAYEMARNSTPLYELP